MGITANPDQIWAWFPKDEYGPLAWHIIRGAGMLTLVFGAITAAVMKDKAVTGGTKASTPEAQARVDHPEEIIAVATDPAPKEVIVKNPASDPVITEEKK